MEDEPVKPNLLQIPVKRIADAHWEVSERALPPLCQVVWDHPHLAVRPRLPVAATQVYEPAWGHNGSCKWPFSRVCEELPSRVLRIPIGNKSCPNGI